jgi:hypothetical protein
VSPAVRIKLLALVMLACYVVLIALVFWVGSGR